MCTCVGLSSSYSITCIIHVQWNYCGQHWDKYKCPDYRGILILGVNLYYKAQFGTFVSVLNTGVSSIEEFHYTTILQ